MSSRFGRTRTAALVLASAAVIASVGGTAFATGHSRGAQSSSGVTRAEVRSIVKAYIADHRTTIQGAEPKAIRFSTTTDHSNTQTVATIGPWKMTEKCSSATNATDDNVAINFSGPANGVVFGTNSLGPVGGGAGNTFQTFGSGAGFAIGDTYQGSQTVQLLTGQTTYSVSYFANVLENDPVVCDIVGYSIKL